MFRAIFRVVRSFHDEEQIKIWIFIVISIGLSLFVIGIIPFLFMLFSILAFHRTLDFEVILKNKKVIKKMCIFISLLPILFVCLFLSYQYKEYAELMAMKDRLAQLQSEYNEADKRFFDNQGELFQKKNTKLSLSLRYSSVLLDGIERFPWTTLNSNGKTCLENRQELPFYSSDFNRQELTFARDYFNSIYNGCYSLTDLKSIVIPDLNSQIQALSTFDVFNVNEDIETLQSSISSFEEIRHIRESDINNFYSYLIVDKIDNELVLILLSLPLFICLYYWLYFYLFYIPIFKSKDVIIFSLLSEREKIDGVTRNINIIKGEKLKSYSVADELTKWHALNQQRVISDKEYQEAKDKLLK